ncbi:hypothetical protein E2C01_009428 [Portunus trituberculatus]|uniref:Uncharacterized protein n=1 Tax=Portunus trituberculatus TaxID=210409 RepID=A0A5B7D4G2_PORTR|nr:hypothetical protein [Portunus trituberculatus]
MDLGEKGPPELGVNGLRGERAFTTLGRAISSNTDGATYRKKNEETAPRGQSHTKQPLNSTMPDDSPGRPRTTLWGP